MNKQSLEIAAPPVAFIGVCERANQIDRGHPIATQHNILGLQQTVISSIFPINLNSFHFVFSIFNLPKISFLDIRLLSPEGEEILKLNMNPIAPQDSEEVKADLGVIQAAALDSSWFTFVSPDDEITQIIVKSPGAYNFVLISGDNKIPIGTLLFHYSPALPLTIERIAAIRSNPDAINKARFMISCSVCKDAAKAYTGLEKDGKLETEGFVWHTNLPDTFVCKCGKTYPLHFARESLHFLLGRSKTQSSDTSITRLYEQGALEKISREYGGLLEKNPPEQDIQKFIQNNPILLEHFSPERIFFKKSILSKFETDIVILTNNKELILIELEKPGIQILQKKGTIAAPLTHAIDQVQNWLHEAEHYREAVLSCIGLKSDEVSVIKGKVVAGRDKLYPIAHLDKLRWTDFGRISFLTYDDLQRNLVNLIRSIKKL